MIISVSTYGCYSYVLDTATGWKCTGLLHVLRFLLSNTIAILCPTSVAGLLQGEKGEGDRHRRP